MYWYWDLPVIEPNTQPCVINCCLHNQQSNLWERTFQRERNSLYWEGQLRAPQQRRFAPRMGTDWAMAGWMFSTVEPRVENTIHFLTQDHWSIFLQRNVSSSLHSRHLTWRHFVYCRHSHLLALCLPAWFQSKVHGSCFCAVAVFRVERLGYDPDLYSFITTSPQLLLGKLLKTFSMFHILKAFSPLHVGQTNGYFFFLSRSLLRWP